MKKSPESKLIPKSEPDKKAPPVKAKVRKLRNPVMDFRQFHPTGLMRKAEFIYERGAFSLAPYLTPSKDQGDVRGQCALFTVVAAYEIIDKNNRDFSEQNTIFMVNHSAAMSEDGRAVKMPWQLGLPLGLEEEWPYNIETCHLVDEHSGRLYYEDASHRRWWCSSTSHQGMPRADGTFTAYPDAATSEYGTCVYMDSIFDPTEIDDLPELLETCPVELRVDAGPGAIEGWTDGAKMGEGHSTLIVGYVPAKLVEAALKDVEKSANFVSGDDYLIVKDHTGPYPHAGDYGFRYIARSNLAAFLARCDPGDSHMSAFHYDNSCRYYVNCRPRSPGDIGCRPTTRTPPGHIRKPKDKLVRIDPRRR